MISFHLILFLHVSLAATSFILFLFRSSRFLVLPRKNQFPILKKITIGIDSLLTITGISQLAYLSYQPLNQYWFLVKMSLLALYILAGIQVLKTNQSQLKRIRYLAIALSAFFLIVYMAIYKPF